MAKPRRFGTREWARQALFGPDGTTCLTAYIVALIVLPARLVFEAIGGTGTPAVLIGAGGFLWWLWQHVTRPRPMPQTARPITLALFAFAVTILGSYISGTLRVSRPVEVRAMDAGLIMLVSWMGVALLCTDGVPDASRLMTLLRRLSVLAGIEGFLGVVQFATGISIVDNIQIPGLSANAVVSGIGSRDGFVRPSGTAIHSIEFGMTMTAVLPLCLYFAMNYPGRSKRWRWLAVAAVSVAIPLSISRSALIGTVVALAVLLPSWTPKARLATLGAVVGLALALFAFVPGFLGTVTNLFTGIGSDDSARSRTDSYSLAWSFIERAPWFGRGFASFLPDYRILDNLYLGLAIEAGFLGLVTFVATFVTGIVLAERLRRSSTSPELRGLVRALTASTAATMSGYAFFDAFAFPQLTGVGFLFLGAVGALYRFYPPGPKLAGPRAAGPTASAEA